MVEKSESVVQDPPENSESSPLEDRRSFKNNPDCRHGSPDRDTPGQRATRERPQKVLNKYHDNAANPSHTGTAAKLLSRSGGE